MRAMPELDVASGFGYVPGVIATTTRYNFPRHR
jgi:hypothetical protein